MDRHELLYRLEEPTKMELFLRDLAINRSTIIDNNNIDEIASPTCYSWSTEKFAHMKMVNKKPASVQSFFSQTVYVPEKKNILITKTMKHLDYAINFSRDFISLNYILRGTLKISIDGKSIILREGNAIIIAPLVEYSSGYSSVDDIVLSINLGRNTLRVNLFNILSGDNLITNFLANSAFNINQAKYLIIDSSPDDRLASLVLEIMLEQEKPRRASNKIMAQSLELFLLLLSSDYENRISINKEMPETDKMASSLISYICENYADISLTEMSRHFSLSSSYISRLLKQKFGKNYIQLLTEIRLSRAKELLDVPNMNVEAISGIIGYSNTSSFRRAFKELFDMSPNEYRRRQT